MKKTLIIIFILTTCVRLYSNDAEDMEYIKKLYHKKYYKESVTEIQIFIKKHTDSPHYNTALNLLGSSYYALEKYKKARTVFKTLITTEFKNNAYYYLALISIKENKKKEADKYLSKIGTKSKLRSEAAYLIGSELYKKNDFKNAEEYLKKTLKYKDDFSTASLLKLGLIYYKQKEFMKADAVLEEYISKMKSKENLALVYYILGYSNDKAADAGQAIKYYKIVEQEYDKSEYYIKSVFNIAKLYDRIKDYNNLKDYVEKLEGSEYELQGLILLSEFEYEKKNYSEAEELYEKILKSKKDHQIIYKLILSLMKQKKYEKALKRLPEIKDGEYRSVYYYYTGFILHKQKKFKKVLERLKNIDKKKIKKDYKEDSYLFAAESAFNIKKYDTAEKYYNELFLLTGNIKYLYHVSTVLHRTKDYKKLEILFWLYKKKFPRDKKYKREIYSSLGELYVENDKYSRAEKIYKEYLKSGKDDLVLNNLIAVLLHQDKYKEMLNYLKGTEDTIERRYSKGLAYSGIHDYKNASKMFKYIIGKGKNPYIERSYYKLIEALFSLEDFNNVIKYASLYLDKGFKKDRTEVIDKKGLAYFKLKKYSDAVKVYQDLKQYSKVSGYAYFMLGEVYYNKKDYTAAKGAYKYIIINMPGSEFQKDSLYWLINITFQNKEKLECVKYCKDFLKKYKDEEYAEEITSYLAEIYIADNKIGLAVKEYEKLYNLTGDKELKGNLAKSILKIYFNKKDYNNALKWAKKVRENSFRKLWMGLIYDKQGKAGHAAAEYRKILNDSQYGDKANYYLGTYYFNNKKYKEARKYLGKVPDFNLSEYKDDAYLKIGLSYEAEAQYQRAISSFMKIKLMYENSIYQDIAHLKIAENYEKLNEREKGMKIYLEFVDKFVYSKYYPAVLEKLLVYYLSEGEKEKAEKYYNDMKIVDEKKAEKYKEHF